MEAGGDRTIVVGQEMGDSERFWAENNILSLPHSGAMLSFSLGLHDLGAGCTSLPECNNYWTLNNIAVGKFRLDFHVPFSFADYANGRDAVMEKVLDLEAGK